jgi:predicted nuclease of restriction endonuclease-like (RecB) superfamily
MRPDVLALGSVRRHFDDFLGLAKEAEERAIKDALVKHITQFLIELGSGFAFISRQMHIES